MEDAGVSLALQWFVALMLLGFGIFAIVRKPDPAGAQALFFAARYGKPGSESRDELSSRLERAVYARSAIERGNTVPIVIGGYISVFLAVALILGWMDRSVAFALGLLTAALAISAVYVGAATRRSSATQPTRARGYIPWLVAALCTTVVPVIYVGTPLATSAMTVSLSALMSVAAGMLVLKAPAILPGHDLPMERWLDRRLRFVRARQMFVLALFVVTFFIFMVPPHGRYQELLRGSVNIVTIVVSIQTLRERRRSISIADLD